MFVYVNPAENSGMSLQEIACPKKNIHDDMYANSDWIAALFIISTHDKKVSDLIAALLKISSHSTKNNSDWIAAWFKISSHDKN